MRERWGQSTAPSVKQLYFIWTLKQSKKKKISTLISLFHLALLTLDVPAYLASHAWQWKLSWQHKESLCELEPFCVKTLCAQCCYYVVYSESLGSDHSNPFISCLLLYEMLSMIPS